MTLQNDFHAMVEYASKAPSGHNTQPWFFTLGADAITITPDFSKRLPVVDPDDRELFISLGCAAENLRNAGRIIAELIVRARHRVDMTRRRSGDEVKKIERVATAVFHNKGDGVVHFLFVYVAVFVCGREGGDRKLLHLATALPSWNFKRIVMLSGRKSV